MKTRQEERLRGTLTAIYRHALQAVDPEAAILDAFSWALPPPARDAEVFVLSIGKAAVPMARAAERELGTRLAGGIAITKHGHTGRLDRIETFEAGHPEPDECGLQATTLALRRLDDSLSEQHLLLFLVSGGGSALFVAPLPPLTLHDKLHTTRLLLRSGASIQEINTVRKHLSAVKGGRLVPHAQGARVLSLILSDVVGDDISSIASGPTAPDPTTYVDALGVLDKYALRKQVERSVLDLLQAGVKGDIEETPKSSDPRFERVVHHVVSNNLAALRAAAETASKEGYAPLLLSSSMTGNNEDIAAAHVAIAREVLASGNPLPGPCCLISGGETTVRVTGDGKGGRNMEFALHCARLIADWDRQVLFASVGTDGTDGPTDAAGALATPSTCRRALDKGLDPETFLNNNDSYHFFHALQDLIVTGPTLTNVMDMRVVLVAG